MAIKGLKPEEVINVYDPKRGAFYETSEKELRTQLEALGFDAQTIDERILALRKKKEA
jgi:hypothetical protein